MNYERREKDFSLFCRDKGISTNTLNDYRKHISNAYIEPYVIEERSLNISQLSVYSRLFMERILFLGTEIDSDVANIINSQILYLEMENPDRTINVYINSPGGSVYDGLSIYDVFKFVSCPISTTCMGLAASMGSVLLSSGDKGTRFALPNSKIMTHQPLGGINYAQASDFEIENKEMQKCKKTLYKILSENTGKTEEEIALACDRNNWMTSKEGVDFGIIDKIIERKK